MNAREKDGTFGRSPRTIATEVACTGCERTLPRVAFRERIVRRGEKTYVAVSGRCRECEAEYVRSRPTQRLDALHRWRENHPARVKELGRKYAKAHPEARAAFMQTYGQEHRPEINAKRNARRAADPEKYRAKIRAKYAENPLTFNDHARRRRARLAGALVTLTKAQWDAVLTLRGNRCVYCGRAGVRLTQDHVVPLSRGGAHTAENVVPACKPCNSSKRDRTPNEWRMN